MEEEKQNNEVVPSILDSAFTNIGIRTAPNDLNVLKNF
jgi:hypothetical protein